MSIDPVLRSIDRALADHGFEVAFEHLFAHPFDGWEPGELELVLRWACSDDDDLNGWADDVRVYREPDAQAAMYRERYRGRGHATTYSFVDEVVEWPADVAERIAGLARDLADFLAVSITAAVDALTKALHTEALPISVVGPLAEFAGLEIPPMPRPPHATQAALRIAEDQRLARARRAPLPPAPFVARHLPRPRGRL